MTREEVKKEQSKTELMNAILDEEEGLFKRLTTYLEQIIID